MANTFFGSIFDNHQFFECFQLLQENSEINPRKLKDVTLETVQQFESNYPKKKIDQCYHQTWPLYEHGSNRLKPRQQIQSITHPSPQDIGSWVFTVLGKYTSGHFSLFRDWQILYQVLSQIGFSQDQVDIMFKGMSLHSLFKDTNNAEWVNLAKPWNAKSGWLPLEKVTCIYADLCDKEDQILKFDILDLPNINKDNPLVIDDYNNRLEDTYHMYLKKLYLTIQEQKSMFISITTYS